MLVLSRGRNETITIGDDVTITVVDIRGDKVRLGITAPDHISVRSRRQCPLESSWPPTLVRPFLCYMLQLTYA